MPISTESSGPRLMCHEPWADACLAAGNASVTRAERARTAEGAGKRIQWFDPRRRAGVTPRELGSLHLHWHGAVGCRPSPSWPLRLLPQQYARPVSVMPHTCAVPTPLTWTNLS